jgi:hypothetical protein
VIRSLIVTAILMVIAGCKREPVADFVADKDIYIAGDVIHLTNTSQDGRTYEWTLPGGEKVNTLNVHYQSDQGFGDGDLGFRLTAFSKDGKKENEVMKTIKIKAAMGDAVFWQKAGTGHNVTVVNVNGMENLITYEYYDYPACGSRGNANYHLPVGEHLYVANDGVSYWQGTIKIRRDSCTNRLLE